MSEPTKKEPFSIGLCMAGAVSAGAYTAGVLDYLFEALDAWEERKRAGVAGTPMHDVVIPVIGGASAGAITGFLTAAVQHTATPPVRSPEPNDLLGERPDNGFYHTWVDMVQRDMFAMMLRIDDLKDDKAHSLINSDFIPQLARRVIRRTPQTIKRNYLAHDLKLFASLTNLEGFDYNVGFRQGMDRTETERSRHVLEVHGDYACFKLNNTTYGGDGWTPLDLEQGVNLQIAANAAMATGAFPVGLKSRRLQRPWEHVRDHPFLGNVTSTVKHSGDVYNSLHVDGGLIDNEPFDKVRQVLNGITGQEEDPQLRKQLHDDFARTKSTVLLIDPFPSAEKNFDCNDDLVKVVKSTLGAMFGQLLVKPEVLRNALSDNCAGQYMIAPSRIDPRGSGLKLRGSHAMACGGLGGFSGFLHKEFRIHDFFLGRMNCRSFLLKYFTFPEAGEINPIFEDGYAHLSTEQKNALRAGSGELPIIPLFGTEREEPTEETALPNFRCGGNWPRRTHSDVDQYRGKLNDRVDELLRVTMGKKKFPASMLSFTIRKLAKGRLTDAVIDSIKDDLRAQDLLDGLQKEKTNDPIACAAPEPLTLTE